MRIKIAILERDSNYLGRIVAAFNIKYADKFEIYSFTDPAIALATLDASRIDVFIANETFEIDTSLLPKRCSFAYFVESPDIEMLRDERVIGKFQKADLIYKQILGIYSEKVENVSGMKFGDESAKIISFSSPCGGVGTSTMAAATAIYFASKGSKVLYLNLEKFGCADLFFSGEGQFDMSDIIFALKSKKTNLSLKLESYVKQDHSGVYFFSQPKIVLDMLELTSDDIENLISEIKMTGSYDYIVLDMDFAIDKGTLNLLRQAHSSILVSDGSELANEKVYKVYQALSVLDQENDVPIINRFSIMYNKFSNKSSKSLDSINIKNIGGAPRYERATTKQVIEQLCRMDMFGRIL